MSKREKLLLVVLLIFAILFGYYYFVMQHQLDNITLLEDDIQMQKNQITIFNTTKENIVQLNQNIKNEEDVLYSNFEPYLKELKQEEIILLLNEILLRSEVTVDSLSFSDFIRGTFVALDYEVMRTSVSVSGSYGDVIAFVSSFWRFDHNIFVESISLSEGEIVDGQNLLFGSVDLAFVRVNNKYASGIPLFSWYNDVFYQKEDPFDLDDLSLLFQPNYFYTGTDVEFFNPSYLPFNDIVGHWANDVINFFGRNGYVIGDESNNFLPDENMTRLETVLLLDLVFRWDLGDNLVTLTSFDDYDQISELTAIEKKALLKAYNSHYIIGYDDNTLRPYNAISYIELGYIGANLLADETVTWKEVALEIQDQFGYESPGLIDEQLFATKAEIIYFLSYIEKMNR